MTTLSRIISNISPSPTLAASQRAALMKEKGLDVISFTVGEPDFDTPEHIKAAAVEALNKGFTKYTAVGGIKILKEAIVAKLKRDIGIDANLNQIIVTNGGKQALASAFSVLLNPGDEVIIPSPYWTSYPDMVKLADGEPKIIQTQANNGYILEPKQLEAACSEKTKAIVINTPSNPTGACYDSSDISKLVEVVLNLKNQKEIIIIADEVYDAITYDGFEHVSLLTVAPEIRENIILVNAFSKTYSMTGWRVGYSFASRQIIAAMENHQSQFTSNVCSIAQYAASHAFDDDGAFVRIMRAEFAKRRDIVCAEVENMSGIKLDPAPRGAFYAFLDVSDLFGKSDDNFKINSASDFSNYLLEKYNVVVVQGEAFGCSDCIRISFALNTQLLQKGLKRIKEAAQRLMT